MKSHKAAKRDSIFDSGIFVAAALVPFLIAIIGGLTLGPWSQIRHMAPWNGPRPDAPWNVLSADSVLQFYGWRDLVLNSWQHFQIPWWNPYILNGTPLLANSQSGALYPPHILCGILRLPTWLAIDLLAWLHLAWAGIGVAWLVRRMGGSRLGQLTAGLSFALSAFMIAWSPLGSVIETVAWIPWCLLLTQRLLDSQEGIAANAYGLAVCVAMMLLAGHLQFAAYGIAAIIVWAATVSIFGRTKTKETETSSDASSSSNSKPSLSAGTRLVGPAFIGPAFIGLAFIGLALILGLILALPQLRPVLQMGSQSHRRTAPSADGYAAYTAGADKWFELPSIASSAVLGLPTADIGPEGAPLPGYWPAYVSRGSAFPETAFAWGPVVFVVVIWGFRRRHWRQLGPPVAIGAVGALLAFGTWLNLVPYWLVPGWSATGSPGRAGVLIVLAGCLLAGVCMPKDDEEVGARSLGPPMIALAAVLGIGMVCANLESTQLWNPQLEAAHLFGPIMVNLLTGVAVALSLGGLTAGAIALKNRSGGTLLAIAACIACPLLLYPVLQTGRPDLTVAIPPKGRIAVVNDQWGLLTLPDAIAPPNVLLTSGIHQVSGYDSLIRAEAQARLAQINGGVDPSPPANGNMMFVKPDFSAGLLAEAGVTEVWSLKPVPGLAGAVEKGGWYRTPLPGPGRASTPAGQAVVQHEDAVSITLSADGPGPLTLRDDLQSDWDATVDGIPAPIDWTSWPTVQLTSGHHTVRFYSREATSTALQEAAVLILALILGVAIGASRCFPPRKTVVK